MADIQKDEIKLMASEVLADTEDGGGQMTSNEIVDGNVNNLFPDISRLDRTYGRVSLRKAYLSIQTADRATYYGAHVALTEQAADPLVGTTLFTTQDWFDRRASCQNRIEGYLVKGPAYPCAVWGDHYSGTKMVSLVVEQDWHEPEIGDVLVLRIDKTLTGSSITAKEQFVRITNKESEVKSFMKEDGGTFLKKEVKLTFGQSLQFDIPGGGITPTSTQSTANVFVTVAADTSLYYGVTSLGVAATAGDLAIKVSDIMSPLVPSANSQTAITDFGPGMTRPIMLGPNNTDEETEVNGSMNFDPNATTVLGFGVKPGTFKFGDLVKDDGGGKILDQSSLEVVGAIEYANGTITMGESAYSGAQSGTFVFEPATKYDAPAKSGSIIVETNNRGFVYVFNCHPSPKKSSIRVDYMSGGKWYSLFDNGLGEIRGSETSIGSGTVNYITGSISLSLGAMPDVGSMIMFYWGVTMGTYDIHSYTTGYIPYTDFVLNDEAAYETLSITWTLDGESGPVAMEVYDAGDGTLNLKMDDTIQLDSSGSPVQVGTYDKAWKTATVQHLGYTPKTSQEYNVYYEGEAPEASRLSESINGTSTASQTYVLTLDEDIKPGSVKVAMDVTMRDLAIGDSYTVTRQDSASWSSSTKNTSKSSWQRTSGDGWRDLASGSPDWNWNYGVVMETDGVARNNASSSDNSGSEKSKTTNSFRIEPVGATSGTLNLYDLGDGNLYYNGTAVGTINYTTGEIVLDQHHDIPTLVKEIETDNSSDSTSSSDSSSDSSGDDSEYQDSDEYGTAHWVGTWKTTDQVTSASGNTYSATGAISKNTTEVMETNLRFICEISDSINISWIPVSEMGDVYTEVVTHPLKIEFPLAPGYHIMAGSLWMDDAGGQVLKDDGMGKVRLLGLDELSEPIADINYSTGVMTITKNLETDAGGLGFGIINGVATRSLNESSYWSFRCPGSPITPGSFTLQVTAIGGEVLTATADFNGKLTGDKVDGYIQYNNGIVEILFGAFHNWADVSGELWAQDAPQIDDGGVLKVFKHEIIQPMTMIMNCVVETYLPLDPSLLGLDPVRLPLDGKVPVFRDGYIVLIHHTQTEVVTPSAGATVTLSRANVNLIELYDNNGVYVPEVGNYSVDLVAGEIIFEDPLDLSAYASPFQAMTRIEDMSIATDVQITGHMGISQPLQHDYPADETMVSSVLPIGDVQARIYNEFTDSSWGDEWKDSREYGLTTAQYDLVNYPIIVTNADSVKERFACIFTSPNTVDVVGEHLGVMLSDAPITADITPINPATGQPYFTIRHEGWGSGWSTGEVFRFNSDAGNYPIWFVRTTQQGPATENSDHYTIQIRGDSS